eukprot:scaffold148379_cov32-Tisochrysis_lutea.AAC.2
MTTARGCTALSNNNDGRSPETSRGAGLPSGECRDSTHASGGGIAYTITQLVLILAKACTFPTPHDRSTVRVSSLQPFPSDIDKLGCNLTSRHPRYCAASACRKVCRLCDSGTARKQHLQRE